MAGEIGLPGTAENRTAPGRLTHPPPARLCFRVGVTGHRPDGLRSADWTALEAQVRQVLKLVADSVRDAAATLSSAYARDPLLIRVVSPVADGSDRIVAQAAVALGFELQCPLPFPRAVYEQDFPSDDSRQAFRALLNQASVVLELDGQRDTPAAAEAAYQAVGRLVLAQSDLLVAVWDGAAPNGRGGTAQMVREALEQGTPTVWVRAAAPHTATLLARGTDDSGVELELAGLRDRIHALLAPPTAIHEPAVSTGRDLRTTYFAERAPRWSPFSSIWRLFADVVGGVRPRMIRLGLPSVSATAGPDWDRAWRAGIGLPGATLAPIDAALRWHYAWADRLADHYANVYRSSFVVNYLLGALVILLEAVVDISGWVHHGSGAARLVQLSAIVAIVVILVVWWLNRRRHWHERWTDYRLLAELLRLFRYTALLGDIPSASALPAHRAYGDPRDTWMTWHFRAVARALGLVPAVLTPEYRESVRRVLRDGLLSEQLTYHAATARRMERLAHHLAIAGMLTFVVALAILVTLAMFNLHVGWLAMAAITLPALGGALAAIRGQGELERVAHRSHALQRQYAHLRDELDALLHPPASQALRLLAATIADTALSEVLDWRVVFQERPLELSG